MAPTPSRDALALAERFSLALDAAPPPGRVGERLARSGGAGTEFHDSRPYQVGDDVRHIDWRAFARSDQLMVRVWRDEVLARVEVLLDASRSMAVEPRKAQCALDVAQLIASAAQGDDCAARVAPIGGREPALGAEDFARTGMQFEARAPFDASWREALAPVRRGSIVVVVSDFLFPHDPRAMFASLAAKAGALACVQVLSRKERFPRAGGAARLIDCEDGRALDLVLEEQVVAGYRRRLEALTGALEEECRRVRGLFVSLDADEALEQLARGPLLSAGVLSPR